jgi:GTP-binding protein
LSAVSGEGVEAVLRGLISVVEEARQDAASAKVVDERWKA